MNAALRPNVVLFFVDGLGIGRRDPSNPLHGLDHAEPLAVFDDSPAELFGGVLRATDATLGVEGRPQSASGQTTILTGVNAARELGYHKQGFPNAALREILSAHSVFSQLRRAGLHDVVFANAYTPQFFENPQRWKSATTVAIETAGVAFRRLPDLIGRQAIFHDFTNRSLIERGFDVPEFTALDAGRILADISRSHSFTLYEHFLTDKIGHDQDRQSARHHVPQLAAFVRETLLRLDLERTTFILTSDHGNIEDLSVRNHTLNDVPTIIWGRKRHEIAGSINDLSDIAPAILRLLT